MDVEELVFEPRRSFCAYEVDDRDSPVDVDMTVYPATALNEQHASVVPMVRVLSDVLGRVGEWDFAGLTLSVPVGLAPDARFDLLGDADWYALAAPDATAEVTVNVTVQVALDAAELAELMSQGSRRLLRLASTAVKGGGIMLVCHAPEWSPDAAAWIAEVLVDSLRAAGVRDRAEVAVSETGTSNGEVEGAWS